MNILPQNMLPGKGVTVISERDGGSDRKMRDRIRGTHMRNSELFVGGGYWRLGSDAKIVDSGGHSNYKQLSRPSLAPKLRQKPHLLVWRLVGH